MATKITTHNGQFHADEVIAYTMLKTIFPNNILQRTRNSKIIEKSNIVIDVGFVYDPNNDKFDHHQENCHEVFIDDNIPMSSAGMVYKKYGKSFIETVLDITSSITDELYHEIYENIIKEVDAIDNGVDTVKGNKYLINTGVSRMISRFNSYDVFNDIEQKKQFMKASDYAKNVLDIIILDLYKKEKLFNTEYNNMKNIIEMNKSKNYIVVNFDCVNWYKCIDKYKKENKMSVKLDWIMYMDNKNWRIRTINKYSKLLKTEEYLKANISKPDEILFVHKGLFIAGASTLETIIEMAELSNSNNIA